MKKRRQIDYKRPVGGYQIDQHAALYYGSTTLPAVSALRWEVDRAARIAQVRGVSRPAAIRANQKAAQHLLKRPGRIEAASDGLIGDRDLATIAADMSLGVRSVGTEASSPIPHLVQILETTQYLNRWTADFVAKFEPAQLPSRSTSFDNAFIEYLAKFHEERTRKKLRKSKSNQFVRFVCAAWEDLGFSFGKKDVETYVGPKIERVVSRVNGGAG